MRLLTLKKNLTCKGSLVEVYLGEFEQKMIDTSEKKLVEAYGTVKYNTAT